ncbi:MAG: LysR family transcriptional regulator [Pseudomonadota bacterium]
MDTKALELFAEVVARDGFTAAARAREADPSAVSRAIAALERELGFRLFERSTRRVALTEAGAAYHARIAPILADLAAARDSARDLVERPRGRLRISASTAFGEAMIVPMLPGFRAAYPEVEIDLVLSDAQLDLIEHRIDLAVRLSPEAPPDTVVARLMNTRYRVVAAPEYLNLHPVTAPQDLAAMGCLVFPFPGFRDRWRFRDRDGAETVVPIKGGVEITGALALAAAARHAMGPALLADWLIAEDLRQGRLVDVFPEHQVTATTFDTAAWILYPSRAYLPLKTRAFIEALRRDIGGSRPVDEKFTK